MTWKGGKKIREDDQMPASPFACLQPLLKTNEKDIPGSFQRLAKALSKFDSRVRIHVRLVDGDQTVDSWEVKGGASSSSAVRRDPKAARPRGPKEAGVLLVVSAETWLQIAQGQLAPFDALFDGKLRVGGNLEVGKKITQHLSDTTVPFVPPC